MNKPEIRFEGFNDEWEKQKLGEIAEVIDGDRGVNYPSSDDFNEYGHTLFLSATNITKNGFLLDSCQYINEEKSLSMGNGKLQLNDVVLTSRGSLGHVAWYHNEIHEKVPNSRINSGMLLLRANNNTSPGFIEQYLKSFIGQKQITTISFGSAQPQLTKKDVYNYFIVIPKDLKEQCIIGNFFHSLDDTISFKKQQCEQTANIKKAMLEKMFTKKGENVPEIRFDGFNDEWGKRKLKDMIEYKNGKGHEDKQSEYGKYELINLNSISIDGGLKDSGKFIDETNETLLLNDLVMILSDVAHGDLLGRVAIIPENNKYVLNQRVALLRPNETVIPLYLFFHINAHQEYFKSQGAGMAQLNISRGSVENFESYVPTEKEEQIAIGNFFHSLDTLIEAQQQEIDKLQNIKKALLNKMFV